MGARRVRLRGHGKRGRGRKLRRRVHPRAASTSGAVRALRACRGHPGDEALPGLAAILGWAFVCALALRPSELRTGYHFRGGIAYGFRKAAVAASRSQNLVGAKTRRVVRRSMLRRYTSPTTKGFGASYIQDRPHITPAPGLHLPTVVTGGTGGLANPIAARH
jgi:hypothetical protein